MRGVADRYDVLGPLGQGGMASAYHVRDRVTGQEMALKRLSRAGRSGTVVELFEREFHTLTQLAHPRIVRAYDYGFDGEHAFYTMELLDGGDLRELAPMPWQEVCAVAYDVCSALSLVHSRRLVHRDLTPRNVRRTADGTAKLIDFGLLEPFGADGVVAGTPPYVAPELVNRISLDARSDLFSLGATLYFALTGRLAFPVKRFEQLRDVWRSLPPSPKRLMPEVPEALDKLVMALIRIDAGSRPRSAAEVMERVKPLLAEPPDENLAVAGAYLTAPKEIGREALRATMREQVRAALRAQGGSLLIAGDPGTGRSRALDSFILEAKLMGGVVARAGAGDGASGPFGVARAIVRQIHEGAQPASYAIAAQSPDIRTVLFGDSKRVQPQLLDVARPGLERAQVQQALRDWLIQIARGRLLCIAVDDFESIDEPSAALVASLALDAGRCCLALGASVGRDALSEEQSALAVLRQRARAETLGPLEPEQVYELLASVFGDVPNLDGLSAQLYGLSGGRPRECMLLSQHLVDHGVIAYSGGAFRLPSSIDPAALPAGLEEALDEQVSALSDAAKWVGRLLSVSATGRLSRAQLISVEGLSGSDVDGGVEALRSMQALAGSPAGYRICHASVAHMLTANLSEEALRRLHGQLAGLCAAGGAGLVAESYHSLRAQDPAGALDRLLDEAESPERRTAQCYRGMAEIGVDRTSETYQLAYRTARSLSRPTRDLLRLWPTLAGLAAGGGDTDSYDLVAEDWLAELKVATGWLDWQALDANLDPLERAMQAFVKATARYEATPEHKRGAAPADAIKELVAYVVFSIAVSSRSLRPELSATLEGLLEPFAPLNPAVNAMYLNAQACYCLALGRREEGRARYIALVDVIDAIESGELAFLDRIRAAVCQAIATQEAALGIHKEDPDQWLRSQDPAQLVGAEYIRKMMALHRGDWQAAEEHRRKAELIGLQNDAKVMFSTLTEELEVHAMARDLTGLRAVRDRTRERARRDPGWRVIGDLADAYYHFLCGEGEETLEMAGRLRAEADGDEHAVGYRLLALVEAAAVEVLLSREEVAAALQMGRRALAECEARGHRHLARSVALAVALAEAHSGAHGQAQARLDRVIAEQQALGVRGLLLGRSYEYLARCAMVAGDQEAFLAASTASAEQYRPGESEILGALHGRLLDDAREAGVIDAATTSTAASQIDALTEIETRVNTAFMGCQGARERANAALVMLQQAMAATAAHVYLLTDAGLTLSASTGMRPDVGPALLAYAEAQMEQELEDDMCTMTQGHPAEGAAAAGSSELRDEQGRVLHPVSLMARRGGVFYVVGVALVDHREADPQAAAVCASIAKYLIDSNEYRPIEAR